MILNSPTISGSLTVTGNIIASGSITLSGSVASASYAANAELLDGLDSTVFTLTSSFTAQTASFTAFTASILSYTSSQNILNGKYATTGSNTFTGIQTVNSNLVVTGSITAQTLVVSTINVTQSFSSGSNIFGNALANTQVFSGSVSMNPGGLFVSSSGLVGIGNIVPAYTLDVTGTGRFTSTLLVSGAATFSDNVLLAATKRLYLSGTSYIQEVAAGMIRLAPSGNDSFDITSSSLNIWVPTKIYGNSESFTLQANTANADVFIGLYNSAGTRRAYIGYGGASSSKFEISNGENGAISFRANGAERASIYNTYDGTGYSTLQVGTGSTAKIMITGNTGATNDCNIGLYGGVGSNDITGAAFIQLRANDSIAWLFQINASNQYQSWYNNGTTWAAVGYQTTGGTWTNSDERRKTNIEDLEYGLKEVLQLKPKKFHFKHDTEVNNIKQKDMGFIAQEVLPIMPLAVDSGYDGEQQYYSMNYANMIPTLVKAIQELKSQNDALQSRIETLESK